MPPLSPRRLARSALEIAIASILLLVGAPISALAAPAPGPVTGSPGAASPVTVSRLTTAQAIPGRSFHRALALKPPADSALNQLTAVNGVACTGNGACVAVGQYTDTQNYHQAMVVTQASGHWSHGRKLLPPANAAADPAAQAAAVACIKVGRCVAVGSYTTAAPGNTAGFIANETRDRWTRAVRVQLPANASTSQKSQLQTVTCRSTGFCQALGSYTDLGGNLQAMALVKPAGGRWSRAREILAPTRATPNPNALFAGLACMSARHCVAVGRYSSSTGTRAMGAIETRGRWHRAVDIRLPVNASHPSLARLEAVSCTPGAICVGVGEYDTAPAPNIASALAVTETSGRFKAAVQIMTAPTDVGSAPYTSLHGISCPPKGLCVAVGAYKNYLGQDAVMYLVRSVGRWNAGTIRQPLNSKGQASPQGISCTGRGHCTMAGYYVDLQSQEVAQAASTG